MTRIAAAICLALTLLCPVLCLAETAEEWAVDGQTCGDVCDAVSIGAVIDKAENGPASPLDLTPAFAAYLPLDFLTSGFHFLPLSALRGGKPAKLPPIATRRQALLQTFLF